LLYIDHNNVMQMETSIMTSPWTSGPYTPVDREIEAFDLEVQGSIPPELNGMLVRIGPNPIPRHAADHNLFFGDGMTHTLTLENGKAKAFANKWVRTPPILAQLGEAPREALLATPDVANTHVIPFGGKVYAMTETCTPYRLSATLETEARDNFGGFIDGGFTAHPHTDLATGRLHAVGYSVNADHFVTHYVFEADGTLAWKTNIPLQGSSWIHDCAMSASFIVILDLPLQYDPACAAAGELAPYRWQPNYHGRVGLRPLNAKTDTVTWFDIDPCWVFHFVNAWEETDAAGKVTDVYCDVTRYPKMFDAVRTGPGDPAPPQLYRWHFSLVTGKLTQTLIDPRIQEFPRIDDRFWGQKHKFAVTTELFRFSGGTGIIARQGDADSQEWGFGEGVVASEGIFVPASDTAGEGEGWILTYAQHAVTGASKASVFDATQVGKGPIGEVILPQRVPYTFHGSWLPSS
jgi:carotenoid cleavage dioxygenase-like enzyme